VIQRLPSRPNKIRCDPTAISGPFDGGIGRTARTVSAIHIVPFGNTDAKVATIDRRSAPKACLAASMNAGMLCV